jgi:uncharacterized membrane protein YhhN
MSGMGRSPFLRAYAAVAAADVVLAATGKRRAARRLTKPALMPLLMAHVAASEGGDGTKPLVLAGLGLSCAGDVALLGEGEGPFAAGLASFLAAHVCYLGAFAKRRKGNARGVRGPALLYGLAWVGLNAVLLPKTGKMRVPVLVYGSALAAMAVAALETGDAKVAAGGAAFMISDGILALDTFGAADIPGADGLVMLTYTAAQALIAAGMATA